MLTTIKCELQSFEDLAKNFAAKELAANREEHDRYPFGPFFDEVLAKAYDVGLLSATLPEDCGGIGEGISALCVLLENISAADASLSGIIFTNTLAQQILLAANGKALLADVLEKAAAAQAALIAFPSCANPSETDLNVEAVKRHETYALNGTVEYTVLGGLAAYALVPARIQGREGFSFFLISLSHKGVTKSNPVFSLGLHACPAVDLNLSAVEARLVGQEGKGAQYFREAADRMHAAVAAIQCGIMRGSFQEALDYSLQRFQGGREIVNWSGLRMILGQMAVEVKIAEMVVSEAAIAVETQAPQWPLYSRAAALHLSELACRLTTDGIQCLGGNGYMKDYGQEKRFRDAQHVQALLGLAPMRRLSMINDILV